MERVETYFSAQRFIEENEVIVNDLLEMVEFLEDMGIDYYRTTKLDNIEIELVRMKTRLEDLQLKDRDVEETDAFMAKDKEELSFYLEHEQRINSFLEKINSNKDLYTKGMLYLTKLNLLRNAGKIEVLVKPEKRIDKKYFYGLQLNKKDYNRYKTEYNDMVTDLLQGESLEDLNRCLDFIKQSNYPEIALMSNTMFKGPLESVAIYYAKRIKAMESTTGEFSEEDHELLETLKSRLAILGMSEDNGYSFNYNLSKVFSKYLSAKGREFYLKDDDKVLLDIIDNESIGKGGR